MNDYISRQAAIEAIKNDALGLVYYGKKEAVECLDAVPAVDVRPAVYGDWVFDSEWWDYVCTNCKGRVGNSKGYDFCPHCGADMRGKRT